jgi:hypothetical protein
MSIPRPVFYPKATGSNSLGHVTWQLSLLPYTTLESTSIDGEIRLEHSVSSAHGTRCEGDSQDVRGSRRRKTDVLSEVINRQFELGTFITQRADPRLTLLAVLGPPSSSNGNSQI